MGSYERVAFEIISSDSREVMAFCGTEKFSGVVREVASVSEKKSDVVGTRFGTSHEGYCRKGSWEFQPDRSCDENSGGVGEEGVVVSWEIVFPCCVFVSSVRNSTNFSCQVGPSLKMNYIVRVKVVIIVKLSRKAFALYFNFRSFM